MVPTPITSVLQICSLASKPLPSVLVPSRMSQLDTYISACFLDASKTFDIVNHDLLLLYRGLPVCVVRLLITIISSLIAVIPIAKLSFNPLIQSVHRF